MLLTDGFENAEEVIYVFLFHCQNVFEHAASGRVVAAQLGDDLAVAPNCNPFGNEVFSDHFEQIEAVIVLRMGPGRESSRIEVWFALELRDAQRDPVPRSHAIRTRPRPERRLARSR